MKSLLMTSLMQLLRHWIMTRTYSSITRRLILILGLVNSRSVALWMDSTSLIPRNLSTVFMVHLLDWLMPRLCLECSMEYP